MQTKTFIVLMTGIVMLAVVVAVSRRTEEQPQPAGAQTTEPLPVRPVAKPRLPAPRLPANPGAEQTALAPKPANWLPQMIKGEWPAKPTRIAIEPYLVDSRRSPESLLAGWRALNDKALLQEAAEKYSHHPQVAYTSIFQSQTPEERRRWLDAFKQAAPDNALADYLSAGDYFKAGQTERAIADLMSATAKTKWQDYSADFILNSEEAYRAAGYSEAQAKAAAALALPLPQLAKLRELGQQIGDLAKGYRQAGDEASAQAAVQMGVSLARRMSEGSGSSWMIQDLVGLATERKVLEGVDPASPYDASGRTIQARLDELTARREELKALGKQTENVLQDLTEQDLIRFLERWKACGEPEAIRWVMRKQGKM